MFEQTFYIQQQLFEICQIRPPKLLDTVSRKRIKTEIANPAANWAVPLAGGQHQGHPQNGLGCRVQFGTGSWESKAAPAHQQRPERAAAPGSRHSRDEWSLFWVSRMCWQTWRGCSSRVLTAALARWGAVNHTSALSTEQDFTHGGFVVFRLTCGRGLHSPCFQAGSQKSHALIKISKMPCLVCGVEQEAAWAARSRCAAEARRGWFHRKEAEPHSPCGEQLAAPAPAQTRPLPSAAQGTRAEPHW